MITVHTPSAADLDEAFTMCNGNGRLCETHYTADDSDCARDATHSALAVYVEGHACDIRNPLALCQDHAVEMQSAFDDGWVWCATCRMPPLDLIITPIGGR